MKVPATFASPVTCFMQGQAYLADTSIGRDLGRERGRQGGLRAQPDHQEGTVPTGPAKAELQPSKP